jgi:lipopolysaccharide transport system permease protein
MSKQVNGPYPLHVFVGLLPWTFFSNAVALAASSLVGSSHLISKVYFPRIIVPVSSIASGLVDFAISFVALLVLMPFYGMVPSASFVLMPVFLLGTIVSALGPGLLFAALIVTYRDFRYVITFVLQLWLYATPVLYGLDIIPARWRTLYALNPMVGMTVGFRASILRTPVPLGVLAISCASAAAFLVVGVLYFLRVERRFADVI